MSTYKSDRYSSKNEIDDLDTLSEKLAADLRKSIKSLEHYPILSDPWFEMAEVFGRMATISDMESKLSAGKNDSATLWETEEQALRYLLEDGKLNLCLRSLVEFKKSQTEARKRGKGPMIDFAAECDKFEKGLGSIFRNAWQHVEVLQTTDLPLLLTHIQETFQAALDMPEVLEALIAAGDLHQRQEVLVFYYLLGVMKHIEDLGESRIMPEFRAKGIFMLGVRVLCQYGPRLLPVHQLKACQALSAVAETEHFITYFDSYINLTSGDDVEVLSKLKDSVLAEVTKDFANRKLVRPLVDAIDKSKRLQKSGESKK